MNNAAQPVPEKRNYRFATGAAARAALGDGPGAVGALAALNLISCFTALHPSAAIRYPAVHDRRQG